MPCIVLILPDLLNSESEAPPASGFAWPAAVEVFWPETGPPPNGRVGCCGVAKVGAGSGGGGGGAGAGAGAEGRLGGLPPSLEAEIEGVLPLLPRPELSNPPL